MCQMAHTWNNIKKLLSNRTQDRASNQLGFKEVTKTDQNTRSENKLKEATNEEK